jgi:hypothetical protein
LKYKVVTMWVRMTLLDLMINTAELNFKNI